VTTAGHATAGEAATDPICGMAVDPERAAAAGRTSEHEGRTYWFCADECKKRFDAEPARYVHAK
jgi:Cu+-exporting ATPase